MAKVYYYSKRYSQQGNAIKTVTHNDYFLLSRTVPAVAPYKLGYRTYSTTLNSLKTYTLNALKDSGFSFVFDDGLTGSGTTANPARVDKDWVNQNYIRSVDWPFTQVGDPTDETLPIAGSYFSVIYPYLNDTISPVVPYVEGNGDMRILRTVTNGEDIAVVYSVWKNYKNTPIDTMLHTDIVYRPPGLASDEYILHVFSATETAMMVEIWSKTGGFRDYAVVVLNGTMMAAHHRLIRLGKQPLTVMIGVTTTADQTTWMSLIRSCNLNATIVKDRIYIGMICHAGVLPGTTINGDGSYIRYIFGEVSSVGVVTLMKNWSATNSEGATTIHANMAILNKTLSTALDSDKDAIFLNLSPTTTLSFGTGYNATNRCYWGGVNSKGYVTAINYHYYTVSTNRQSRDAKPSYYYDIDFENRRVIPSTNATNRRWAYETNSDNIATKVKSSKTYLEGHYFADGRMVGLLNNGDRYCQHIPGNTGIGQIFYLMRGNVTSIDTGTDDTNFANENFSAGRWLDVVPPTPMYSGLKATILYDKLRVVSIGGENPGYDSSYKSLNNLEGAINGKRYTLLDASLNKPAVVWTGYPLNNNRTAIADWQPSGVVAVRKNGIMYYHNAAWTSNDGTPPVYKYGIDSNSIGRYSFKISQTVIDQMNAFKQSIPLQAGFSQPSSSYWSIVPIYPGIGNDFAIVRFLSSSKSPDSTGADGWARSGTGQIIALAPITYVIDSLGVATITNIDLSKISNITENGYGVNTLGNNVWHQYGSAAIDIKADGYDIIHRGGVSGSFYTDGTTYPMWPIAMTFGSDLVRRRMIINPSNVGYGPYPTISPTHGIGFIDLVGLGAFYAFRPYNIATGVYGGSADSYIVGTARPAAGFNLTVNTPFTVYTEGRVYTVPVQTYDLTTISSAYKNATFYGYVVIRNGLASFEVSATIRPETLHCIYVGYIKTSDTEITEINCTPITRWETARASIYPAGNTLPVSTGLPHETDVKVWENVTTITGTPQEYMWGNDDIVDSDIDYMITDLYWAYDQQGMQPITADPLFGETIYLIVKTLGIDDYVDITFDSNDLQQNDLQDGNITGTVRIPLTYNVGTNVGIGYQKVRTWEVDDMAFNNATWLDVTTQRAFNIDYTNDLNFAIQVNITVHLWDTSAYVMTTLLVDGVVVGGGRVDVKSGDGQSSATLTAIVPAKSKYRLVQGSGASIGTWAELGRR